MGGTAKVEHRFDDTWSGYAQAHGGVGGPAAIDPFGWLWGITAGVRARW